MEAKKRTPSKELQILEILSLRHNLSEKDKQHYHNLRKGYEGELLFDQILEEQLQCEYLMIKDLLLTINNTTFQIDTLIIFQKTIEFFEIKNYEGEYCYEKDKFYVNKNFQITNPEHQLERATTLLRQLLHSHGFNTSIKSSVVFVNPEFTLFNSPVDKPFILPSQINSLINKLNANPSRLTKQNKVLAKKLISLHQIDSHYHKLPDYTYDQLRKGIICEGCNSFSIILEGHSSYCTNCGKREKLASAIIRSTRELALLFPNEKITTHKVYDWCRITSKQRIRKILTKHLTLISKKRWSYFEWK